jgi:hypothetical protein
MSGTCSIKGMAVLFDRSGAAGVKVQEFGGCRHLVMPLSRRRLRLRP